MAGSKACWQKVNFGEYDVGGFFRVAPPIEDDVQNRSTL